MAETWATSGLDLHVDVAGSRVRRSLEEALREAIRSGRLPEGLRVPSSRQLAADLGLARNTVADAYGQLIAEGWLAARQGSGTRVARRVPERDSREHHASSAAPRARYDLRSGTPDLSSFPTSAWMAAMRRSLATVPAEALGYGDPRGRAELREALSGYLARARGVRTDPGRIVVCSGFAQGLALLCSVLLARAASTVAVEAYCLPACREIISGVGLRPFPLPVDEQGAATETLTDQAGVVLTPAHQFPLGPSLQPSRRSAAVDWAADSGGIVVEDDYDGEFRYDRHPLGAMQALAPDHVVYLGTASKTLAPGLRLAWLALPEAWVEPVLAAKAHADYTGALEQLTLAEFITSGGYDRHIRGRRLAYRRRRDMLVRALASDAADVAVTGVAAGLHALVTLPEGVSEEEIGAGAARRGLAVGSLAQYHAGGDDHRPALVVGYATPPDHAYSGALARLVATLTSATALPLAARQSE
jgi:GntR family transcriptional regulator/MocR family aminotransferase